MVLTFTLWTLHAAFQILPPAPMVSRAAPQGTQAVRRAVALLKAFTDERPERSLQDLCAELGLTKTTAFRLLSALAGEGLVEQDTRSRSFRLGPTAIVLGQRALGGSNLRFTARPALLRLAAASGETATLEVPIETEMLILDEVPGRHVVAATAEVGTRWPLHATSTGRAVLAAMAEEPAKALLRASLDRAKVSRREHDGYWRDIERARKRGFVVAAEEIEAGFVAVGAAFRDARGEPAGALSIGGPSARLDRSRRRELGEQVRAEAARLEDGG